MGSRDISPDWLPEWLTAAFRTVEVGPSATAGTSDGSRIYSYRNDEGRTVFVNHPDLVPPQYRPKSAAVDLSHVSLNRELAHNIEAATDAQLEALQADPLCQGARHVRDDGTASHAWHTQQGPLFIAAIGLSLLLISPWVAKRVGGGRWGRVLLFVLPILALLAGVTYATQKASAAVREAGALASLCDGVAQDSDGVTRRSQAASLVGQLQSIYATRERKVEELLEAASR